MIRHIAISLLSLLLTAGKGSYCRVSSMVSLQPSTFRTIRAVSIVLLASITFFMLSAKVYHQTASAAVAPSTYQGEDNYEPIEYGGEVQWSVVNTEDEDDASDGDDVQSCPGDTQPEMSIGYLISLALAAGLAGLAAALAVVAVTGLLVGVSANVIEGLRVACPPPHPDHLDYGAYWTHFGTEVDEDGNTVPVSKIVFAYRPCFGFITSDSDNEEKFKGVSSGFECFGGRIGDDGDDQDGDDNYISASDDYWEWEGDTKEWVHGAHLGIKDLEDKLCLYMDMGVSDLELVCQYKKPPDPPAIPSMACFMPKVCADANALDEAKTKLPFSISATLVRCIEGTIEAVFFDRDSSLTYYQGSQSTCPTTSFAERMRLIMKRTVTGLLTLYIIFYGMKIAFGVQIPQRNEFFMKMITFALVSYFALGDGWREYFPALIDITNTLAVNIMDTTTSGGSYCNFDIDSYEDGFEHNKLWDTLDCKIITYFFADWDSVGIPKLLSVGFYTFFEGGILILLMGIVFAIFLVLILIFAINIYIAAFIGTAILVFMSPIFVPMALFQPTRKYFDGWLDEIIGFALYPVLLFGFLALMLVSIDSLMYNETIQRTPSGDISFTNDQNEWFVASPDTAICSLRDRNPLILAEYTVNSGTSATALGNCEEDCWIYEAKLVDPSLSVSEDTDCDDLAAYAAPPGGDPAVVALCKKIGVCNVGDYKPKFRYYCGETSSTYDTREECLAAEVCPSGSVPGDDDCVDACEENDCVAQCDSEGFGCQLYRARVEKGNVEQFEMGTALLGLLKVLGIGILFFHFLSVIGPMIAELTGNRKSSLQAVAINPSDMMKKGANKLAAAASGGMSKGMSKARAAVKRD